MIEIDGSFGEGGGQIIRTALALSSVFQVPVKIKNIRAKRSNPGLRPQHMWVVKSLKELTDAEVTGDYIGSQELYFCPRTLRYRDMNIHIGTAGSITLVFQSLLIPLLLTDKPLRICVTGGTDVKFAPTIDYFKHVFLKCLNQEIGANVKVMILRRGFYPKGGGEVIVEIEPPRLKKFILTEFQEVRHIKGISVVQGLPEHVLKRQTESAMKVLVKYGYEYRIEKQFIKTGPPGTSITLWAENNYIGSQNIGEKGVPVEKIGRDSANELVKEIEKSTPVDRYLGDQLVPYLMFVRGKYRTSEITEHTKTNIYVCNLFEEKIKIEENTIFS